MPPPGVSLEVTLHNQSAAGADHGWLLPLSPLLQTGTFLRMSSVDGSWTAVVSIGSPVKLGSGAEVSSLLFKYLHTVFAFPFHQQSRISLFSKKLPIPGL